MSDDYQVVNKSALKLKGVSDDGIQKKKKKKKSKEKDRDTLEALAKDWNSSVRSDNSDGASTSTNKDPIKQALERFYGKKTKSELSFLKRKLELEHERLKKRASLSHKDRVQNFNEYLNNLSEHYEQAKVSWTK